jgi:hypothetical protein
MSRQGSGGNWKQAGASAPYSAARRPGVQIGGFQQRTTNAGPVKPIKGGGGTQQITNQALFNKVMNSPVTTKEKIQGKVAGVKNAVSGKVAALKGAVNKATGNTPRPQGSYAQGTASVNMPGKVTILKPGQKPPGMKVNTARNTGTAPASALKNK